MKRKFSVVLFASIVQVCSAEPEMMRSEVIQRMRAAEVSLGDFTGTERVALHHVGGWSPDLSRSVIAKKMPEGDYRWYVQGNRWWMVKTLHADANKAPEITRYIIRNYGDKVLASTDFQRANGQHYFSSAQLSSTSYQAYLGPLAGRLYTHGSISEVLERLSEIQQSSVGSNIEVEGLDRGVPLHLTISPRYEFLVTRLLYHPKGSRYGFTIKEVRRLGDRWVPERMQLENGEYENGRLVKGWSGSVTFSDFRPSGPPSFDEAPPIPPGAMFGGDGAEIFRVGADGRIFDAGHQNGIRSLPFGYGDVFVISGAGILLTSLSWLVFRKRRSAAMTSRR